MSNALLSGRFNKLLEEIYKDEKVTPLEHSKLKKLVGEEQAKVLEYFPQSEEVKSLCDSYNNVVEKTQSVILSLRNKKDGVDDDISDLGIAQVYAFIQ